MNETVNARKVIAVTGASLIIGAAASYMLIDNSLKRTLSVWTCTKEPRSYPEIHSILKSGAEFIIVNPQESWRRNSFLVSQEMSQTPLNWRLRGLRTERSQWSGFKLVSNDATKYPIIAQVKFNAVSGMLSIKYGKSKEGYKQDDINVTCKPTGSYYQLASKANNVPLGYLKGRSSKGFFMIPDLSDKEFNASLLSEIRSKENSEYAQYQLLSSRAASQVDAEERSIMQRLKEELIESNTRKATVWEFDGSYRFNWQRQYPNERQEADNNAGEWCRGNQYTTRNEFLKQGYRVVSSRPDQRSTYGWAQKRYSNGRFGGYVNYKAYCDGTTYELKLSGGVDEVGQNSYSD